MKKKDEKAALQETIKLLEQKQGQELIMLRDQFYVTYESIKPVNIFKKALHDIIGSSEIKNDILSNVIGLATGFISKKIIVGSSNNPFKKILGTILEYIVANFVTRKAESFTENDQ